MESTDIDTWAIKLKIVDLLDNDSTLFSATGASGKVRKIIAGAPDLNDIKNEDILPIIYVTNDNVIDDMRYSSGSVVGAVPKVVEHILGFRIILITEGKNGPDAEEKTDDFVKLILEIIEENYDLATLVDSCIPVQHFVLNQNMIGSEKQGRIIRLKCRVHSTGS